eukprot:g75949.t1
MMCVFVKMEIDDDTVLSQFSQPPKPRYAFFAMDQESLLGFFCCTASALLWGGNFVVIKVALREIGVFTFASLRQAGSALVLLVAMVSLRKPLTMVYPWKYVVAIALGQSTGFVGFMCLALVAGGAGKIGILVTTYPFWTLLLAWPALGERIQGLQWPCVLTSALGMFLVLEPWAEKYNMSSLLAICAAISWAFATTVQKHLGRQCEIDALTLNFWQMVVGTLPLLLIALAFQEPTPKWNAASVCCVLYMVLVNPLAWTVFMLGLRMLSAGSAAMIQLLTPVLGIFLASVILHESPSAWMWAGLVLIIVGLMSLSVVNNRTVVNESLTQTLLDDAY